MKGPQIDSRIKKTLFQNVQKGNFYWKKKKINEDKATFFHKLSLIFMLRTQRNNKQEKFLRCSENNQGKRKLMIRYFSPLFYQYFDAVRQ